LRDYPSRLANSVGAVLDDGAFPMALRGSRADVRAGRLPWDVWPVIGGKRSGTATVQATLTIG
jgi:hypothetical protein